MDEKSRPFRRPVWTRGRCWTRAPGVTYLIFSFLCTYLILEQWKRKAKEPDWAAGIGNRAELRALRLELEWTRSQNYFFPSSPPPPSPPPPPPPPPMAAATPSKSNKDVMAFDYAKMLIPISPSAIRATLDYDISAICKILMANDGRSVAERMDYLSKNFASFKKPEALVPVDDLEDEDDEEDLLIGEATRGGQQNCWL
ncbi:junction-mediating and -regulatory protein-like isoform X3 [Triticum dicoccoides]|nr:junction-mediating and -regulatory protein-like isoform X3 [Triticum dicoccoides]